MLDEEVRKKRREAWKKRREERREEHLLAVKKRHETKEYRRCLVSFIDVLGFKSLIETRSPADILEVLRSKDGFDLERYWENTGYPPEWWPITYNFSDLIVNVLGIDNYKSDELGYPMLQMYRAIGFLQSRLVHSGIFVRGGITIGDIYADERVIFGPALVTAYELESKTAKWPIIAIDDVLVSEMRKASAAHVEIRTKSDDNPVGAMMMAQQLELFVRRTSEGVYFLDYLECLAYEDMTTGDLGYYLKDHKQGVIDAHKRHRHYKYGFVAQYHDEKCKEHRYEGDAYIIGTLD